MQKAASSFLRGLLVQVPSIAVSPQQELNFFRSEEDRSLSAYLACFPEERPVLFENSPVYFREGAACAPAIAEILGAREPILSLLLRDPVEAVLSHHDMRLRQGLFERNLGYQGDPTDLMEFLGKNPTYINDWRYGTILERYWMPHFPQERLLIRTFEEFTADPVEVIRDLAGFCGIDRIGPINTNKAWKNPRPASPRINQLMLLTNRNRVLRAARRGAMAIPGLRRASERILFNSPRTAAKSCKRMDDVKAQLTEILRSEVMRVCELMSRDSLPWPNFFPDSQHRLTAAAPCESS